jgi:hypothetical protein
VPEGRLLFVTVVSRFVIIARAHCGRANLSAVVVVVVVVIAAAAAATIHNTITGTGATTRIALQIGNTAMEWCTPCTNRPDGVL